MSEVLSEDEVSLLKDVFNMFDKDQKGKIFSQDIGGIMETVGWKYNMDALKELLQELNGAGSEEMDFVGFLNMMGRKLTGTDAEYQASESFEMLDKDNQGHISLGHLLRIARGLEQQLNQVELEALLMKVRGGESANADSQIDKTTFLRMAFADLNPPHGTNIEDTV